MKIKKGIQAVGLFIGLYILLQIGFYFLMHLFQEQIKDYFDFMEYRVDSGKLIFLIVLQSLIFLFLFWRVFIWRNQQTSKQRTLKQYFQKRWQWKGWTMVGKYVLGCLVIYLLINGIVGGLMQYYHLEIPGLYGEQMVIQLLQGLSLETRWDKVLIFIAVAFGAPWVEEIIWRGFVTDRLMKSRQGEGVFLAALLFATAHMEWGVVWNLVILSFFLGYIYWKTGSLRYSFLFHVLINGMAMVVIVIQS